MTPTTLLPQPPGPELSAGTTPVPQPADPIQNLTPEAPKPATKPKREQPDLDADSTEAILIYILERYGDAPRPSYDQLAKELGFPRKQNLSPYVNRLVSEGCLARTGPNSPPILTPHGRWVLGLVRARGQSLWRRTVVQWFGEWSRPARQAVVAAARERDREYRISMDGLLIRKGKRKGEKVRKKTDVQILKALRLCCSWGEALKQLGELKSGSLRDRVDAIFSRAKRQQIGGA